MLVSDTMEIIGNGTHAEETTSAVAYLLWAIRPGNVGAYPPRYNLLGQPPWRKPITNLWLRRQNATINIETEFTCVTQRINFLNNTSFRRLKPSAGRKELRCQQGR